MKMNYHNMLKVELLGCKISFTALKKAMRKRSEDYGEGFSQDKFWGAIDDGITTGTIIEDRTKNRTYYSLPRTKEHNWGQCSLPQRQLGARLEA